MQNTGIVLLSQLVLRTLCHSSTEMETGRGQRWTNRVIQDGVGAQHDAGRGPAIPAASAPRSSSARRLLPLGRKPNSPVRRPRERCRDCRQGIAAPEGPVGPALALCGVCNSPDAAGICLLHICSQQVCFLHSTHARAWRSTEKPLRGGGQR